MTWGASPVPARLESRMHNSGRRLRGGIGVAGPRHPSPFGPLARRAFTSLALRVRHVLIAALAVLYVSPARGASAPSEEYRGDTGSVAAREARSQLRSACSEPGGTVGDDAERLLAHRVGFGHEVAGLGVEVPTAAGGISRRTDRFTRSFSRQQAHGRRRRLRARGFCQPKAVMSAFCKVKVSPFLLEREGGCRWKGC